MIELSEDYRIYFGIPENVTLQKRHVIQESNIAGKKTKRAGESEWRSVGYHSSIKAAIKQYIEEDLTASSDLVDLFSRLNFIESKLDDLFKIRFSPFYDHINR